MTGICRPSGVTRRDNDGSATGWTKLAQQEQVVAALLTEEAAPNCWQHVWASS
jgi:hypothetical protein